MTIADVFIIESLTKTDEVKHRYEGQRLAELLRLSGKNPKYFYFQSKSELPHLLKLFKISDYRYLHVSCHASSDIVATTNENLSHAEFAKIFKGYLKLKRVFSQRASSAMNHLLSAWLKQTKACALLWLQQKTLVSIMPLPFGLHSMYRSSREMQIQCQDQIFARELKLFALYSQSIFMFRHTNQSQIPGDTRKLQRPC